MATKADFTAEEWGKLLGSPMVAGMAITQPTPVGSGVDKGGHGWRLGSCRSAPERASNPW